MTMTTAPPPALACRADAIPREERAEHLDRMQHLFRERLLGSERLRDGYAFRFHTDDLVDVGRFVANERRCCPFLGFEIDVDPAAREMTLRMTGPRGTREFLRSELKFQGGYDGQTASG